MWSRPVMGACVPGCPREQPRTPSESLPGPSGARGEMRGAAAPRSPSSCSRTHSPCCTSSCAKTNTTNKLWIDPATSLPLARTVRISPQQLAPTLGLHISQSMVQVEFLSSSTSGMELVPDSEVLLARSTSSSTILPGSWKPRWMLNPCPCAAPRTSAPTTLTFCSVNRPSCTAHYNGLQFLVAASARASRVYTAGPGMRLQSSFNPAGSDDGTR